MSNASGQWEKSVPAIPNLLETLRASRPPRGTRGKPRDVSSGDSKDKIVQQTDNDAALSRLSAVELGYLEDPFARAFSNGAISARRMPIINRGTYVRTTSIDLLVKKFMSLYEDQPTQIISLGAGTDTRYFRLLHKDPSLQAKLVYHEIDFPASTTAKIHAIKQAPDLHALIGAPSLSDTQSSLTTASYHIHGLDLRDLLSPDPPPIPNLNPTMPTLLLSELCLTYLEPATSTPLLQRLTQQLLPGPTPLHIACYEPLHPDDAFGRTMTANLAARGLALPGMLALPTLAAHAARLAAVGFGAEQGGLETRAVWAQWVPEAEKERLRGLEMVDEEEEWVLLAAHYGVVWGSRGRPGLLGGGDAPDGGDGV